MTDKVVKRGYVKWEDENGFHKEPLADHPELLVKASPKEQLYAEEARRLNESAEVDVEETKEEENKQILDVLADLKAAPAEVTAAAALTEEEPISAPEDGTDEETDQQKVDHEAKLAELRGE